MLKNGGDFNGVASKTSVPAGTTNTPGRAVLISRACPMGAKAFLEKWSATVIDIGFADQIYFQITRNGQPLQAGLDRIPALQFQYQPQLELGILLFPGTIEIVAYNISGMSVTIEPDAVAAVAVNALAWWSGSLVSERGGM